MQKAGGTQQPQHLDAIIGNPDFMDDELKKFAKDALKHRLLADQRESQARIAKAEFETEKVNSERKEFRDKRHAENVRKADTTSHPKGNARPHQGKYHERHQRPNNPLRHPPTRVVEVPQDKVAEQVQQYVEGLFEGKPIEQPVLHREETKSEERVESKPLTSKIKGLEKFLPAAQPVPA